MAIIKYLNDIQDSLTTSAKLMQIDLEENSSLIPTEACTAVTTRDYYILNAIFEEYTDTPTSNNFSIFSKYHDI